MYGIVIMGFPCSGKTTACKFLKEEKGLEYISTGDIVRELAEEELGKDYTSSELGEFSTRRRQEDVVYATKGALEKARNKNLDTVVLEGIRCTDEIDYLEQELDQLLTLFIDVPFEERASRLIDRGREGETSIEDMKERDERERGWGLGEIVNREYYDLQIDGNCDENKLKEKVFSVLKKHDYI